MEIISNEAAQCFAGGRKCAMEHSTVMNWAQLWIRSGCHQIYYPLINHHSS